MGWKFGRTTLTHFSVSSPSQNFRSVVSNLHQNFRSLFCNYSWEKNSSFPSRLLLLHFPFFFWVFFTIFPPALESDSDGNSGIPRSGEALHRRRLQADQFLALHMRLLQPGPIYFLSCLNFIFNLKKKKNPITNPYPPTSSSKSLPPKTTTITPLTPKHPPIARLPSRRAFSGLSNEPAHTDLELSSILFRSLRPQVIFDIETDPDPWACRRFIGDCPTGTCSRSWTWWRSSQTPS
jgi:hypothetical protein